MTDPGELLSRLPAPPAHHWELRVDPGWGPPATRKAHCWECLTRRAVARHLSHAETAGGLPPEVGTHACAIDLWLVYGRLWRPDTREVLEPFPVPNHVPRVPLPPVVIPGRRRRWWRPS